MHLYVLSVAQILVKTAWLLRPIKTITINERKKNKAQRFIEFVRPRYSLEIGLKASQQTDWRGCVYIFNCTRLLTIQDMALFSRSLIQRHRAVGEYLETQWWKNDQLPWKHWLRFISGRHWCKHHKWPISIWRHKFMYRKKTVKI